MRRAPPATPLPLPLLSVGRGVWILGAGPWGILPRTTRLSSCIWSTWASKIWMVWAIWPEPSVRRPIKLAASVLWRHWLPSHVLGWATGFLLSGEVRWGLCVLLRDSLCLLCVLALVAGLLLAPLGPLSVILVIIPLARQCKFLVLLRWNSYRTNEELLCAKLDIDLLVLWVVENSRLVVSVCLLLLLVCSVL